MAAVARRRQRLSPQQQQRQQRLPIHRPRKFSGCRCSSMSMCLVPCGAAGGGHRRRFSIASATVWQLRRPLRRQPGWAAAARSVASERAGVIRSLKTDVAFADARLCTAGYPTRQRGEPRGRPRFTEGRQPGSPPARASSFRFIMKMQSRPHVHLHCEPPLRGRGRPRPGPTRDT